jgi:hypothetical protein
VLVSVTAAAEFIGADFRGGFGAGWGRLIRCQIAARLPTLGVEGDPCPSRTLIAHPAAANTRQARPTVLLLQPTRLAISSLVAATLRPVA